VVRHPLFFLDPLRKLFCGKAKFNDRVVPPPADEDSDVAAMRTELTSKLGTSTRTPDPIEVVSLRKVYKGGKVAVENLTFSIPNGECFGLLGPNGAGKTTTISMLTGLYPPNGGSARVCGFDLRTQMDRIYDAMGVCPQFDILWPLLSVVETLMFYCKVKGVPKAEQREMSLQAADNVDLGHVPQRFVGRLSGGMKRRVSLAISLIGDPKVVFLDEPTTGLDPETKRLMWSLVDMFKANRVIVLTTHSMEEADALCGRIGIMAYGKLRCLGTSLHLKNKFGDGYKIEVTHEDGKATMASEFVQALVPKARKVADFAGVITFQVPVKDLRLSELFEAMESRPDTTGIIDWALRQTSMEEVFLKVAHAAEVTKLAEMGGVVVKADETSVPPSPPASDRRVAPGPPPAAAKLEIEA